MIRDYFGDDISIDDELDEATKKNLSEEEKAIKELQKKYFEEEDGGEYVFECENLNLSYGEKQVLHNINVGFYRNQVTAFIGPSGCGKSTLLRCLNRMNDEIGRAHV